MYDKDPIWLAYLTEGEEKLLREDEPLLSDEELAAAVAKAPQYSEESRMIMRWVIGQEPPPTNSESQWSRYSLKQLAQIAKESSPTDYEDGADADADDQTKELRRKIDELLEGPPVEDIEPTPLQAGPMAGPSAARGAKPGWAGASTPQAGRWATGQQGVGGMISE